MNLKLVGLMALCGAAIVACGDSTGSGGSGGSGASSNGGNSDGGTTNVGGNGNGGEISLGGQGTGGGTTEPACYDEGGALQLNEVTLAVGLGECTTTQVDEFFANCLTQGGDCDTWLAAAAANGTCGGCLLGVDDLNATNPAPTGNLPPLIQGNVLIYVQVAACEASAQNLPDCAFPATQLLFCGQTACEENCDTSTDEFTDCANYAISEGICSDLVVDAACDPVFNPTTPDPRCDGTTFEELYTNIANYFCGAPG